MKELSGKITIGRPQYGDGRELVSIRITDELSREKFLEIHMSPRDFGMALTDMSETACSLFVNGLENVGLKKIQEARTRICPLKTFSRQELEKWLIDNAHEEGWTVNPYLGSQTSQSTNENGERILRYFVYKYVDEGDCE